MKGEATYLHLSEVVACQMLTFPNKGMLDGKGGPCPFLRAAKEDFATMVLQERPMHMFNNNLQASDGCSPSQADREAKFRAQQEREAEEFVNILDDEYAIILEAVQSKNPKYYLPKAAEKHRPKQKQKDDASKESKKKIKMITQQHLQHQNNLPYNQRHQV